MPDRTGSGESAFEIERSVAAADVTEVVAVALLFARFESAVGDETVAVLFTRLPAPALTLATRVIVAEPRLATVPRFAVTVPAEPTGGPVHVPTVGVHDTNVVPVGSGSLTTTLAAAAGPALLTVIVHEMLPPTPTGSGRSVFVMLRSARATTPTLVDVDDWLLPIFVSGVAAVTTAVFVRVTPPGAVTLTAIERVAKPGAPIVPKLAVTVPFDPGAGPLQLP